MVGARLLSLLLLATMLAGVWAQGVPPAALAPLPVPYVGAMPPAITKGKLKLYLVLGSSMMFGLTRNETGPMCPVRPDDTAPHPRLLYFRQSGKWSDSAGDLWGQPNHVSAAELLGRALAERDPDSYIGIVAYSFFGSTLRMWTSAYRMASMGAYVLESVKRTAEPVTKSAVRTGYGQWAGILYVGAGGGKEDALLAVRDWRAALGVPDLPIALTGVAQEWFDPEKPGDKGVPNVVALSEGIAQGRIDYWNPEAGTFYNQDSHYGRDGHAAMARATAEAFVALARGEKARLARGPITPVLMGTLDGPPSPTALAVDPFGRCLVLGQGALPDTHVVARFGHAAPTADDLTRPRPRSMDAAWQTSPPASALVAGRECVLAVTGDRLTGWFSHIEPATKDTPAVTTWAAGMLNGEGVQPDGSLDGVAGIKAVVTDRSTRFFVLAGDCAGVEAIEPDAAKPGEIRSRTRIPLPWAASGIAGSFGRLYALSAAGDRLFTWRQYEEPKTIEIALAQAIPEPSTLVLLPYQGLLVASGTGGLHAINVADGKVSLFMPTPARLLIGVDGPRDLLWTADRDTGKVTLSRLTWESHVTDAAGAIVEPPRRPTPSTVTRVEATVKRITALPDAKTFPPPPYKDGLLCVEYTVQRILSGTLPEPDRVLCAVRAVADGRVVLAPMPKVGDRFVLNVTPLNEDRRELQLPLADDIQDLATPLYLVVGSEALPPK